MEVIDEKLNIDSKINLTDDIERLNKGGQNTRVDNLIKLEQNRIDEARKSIELQIKHKMKRYSYIKHNIRK